MQCLRDIRILFTFLKARKNYAKQSKDMESTENLRIAVAENYQVDIQPTSRFPPRRCVFNALIKEQTMDDEGLSTLMCEVESIVNGRPITKVSDDPKNLEALTPFICYCYCYTLDLDLFHLESFRETTTVACVVGGRCSISR
jgi:hypothetical protein